MKKLVILSFCLFFSLNTLAREPAATLSDIGIFNATVPSAEFTDSMLEERNHKLAILPWGSWWRVLLALILAKRR